MGIKEIFDSMSRFMDPIFGVLRIIFGSFVDSPADVLVVGYYFFFALILYWSMIGKETVRKYLGFLYGTFSKGLFYILANILFGILLGAAAVFNMIRFCQSSKDQKNDEPVL
ncbi:UNKNOWN [Stylonychia lemnae]|uniref:Uncharacterized protein n=1 Tax=Stylonychia lemnae TaxID=5949 RepID=A0A078AUY2_STYLE|nr:UNKNOWN [Stylonychia lemnae]|eukprot:CDW86200.1 UNKNOWN [Stylonychia lemnae]